MKISIGLFKSLSYLLLASAAICSVTFSSLSAQSWKSEAEAMIAAQRMGPVKINFSNGQSLTPGDTVSVRVRMKEHAFKWGTTVNINEVIATESNGFDLASNHPYFLHFRNFNSVTPENAGKWHGWSNQGIRTKYLSVVDWLDSLGIANRGHTTIWPSISRWNAVPAHVVNAKDQVENGQVVKTREEVIRGHIQDHIRGQMKTLNGKIYEMDVVNELVHEGEIVRDLLKLNGDDRALEHSQWYKWAKEYGPDIKMVANEYDLFQSGNNFAQRFAEYIQTMLDDGAPIDVIGMQGHFWQQMPTYQELKRRLSEVAVLGLPMVVTEFDMTHGSGYQEMERVLYAVFSEPLMEGFSVWGAWDGRQWRNNGPIYAEDWSVKESGRAYFDLVKGEWWTDTTLVYTGEDEWEFPGFLGTYDLQVTYGDQVQVSEFTLDKAGQELQVNFGDAGTELPDYDFVVGEGRREFYPHEDILLKVKTEDSIAQVVYKLNGSTVAISSGLDPSYTLSLDHGNPVHLSAEILFANQYWTETEEVTVVANLQNTGPSIISTFPPYGTKFFSTDSIELFVQATDPDGDAIAIYVFNSDDQLLGKSDQPGSVRIGGLDEGQNFLTVRAQDERFAFAETFLAIFYDKHSKPPQVDLPAPTRFSHEVTDPGQALITWEFPDSVDVIGNKVILKNDGISVAVRDKEFLWEDLEADVTYELSVQAISENLIYSDTSETFSFMVSDSSTVSNSNFLNITSNVFPNPVYDVFYVEGFDNQLINIDIYNQHGQMMRRFFGSGSSAFDLTELTTGIYFGKLYADGGSQPSIFKIMKQ